MKKHIRSRSDSDFFAEKETFDLIHHNLKKSKFKSSAVEKENLNKTLKSQNECNSITNFSQNYRKSMRYYNERNSNGTRKP
jgi:hypothetical protein